MGNTDQTKAQSPAQQPQSGVMPMQRMPQGNRAAQESIRRVDPSGQAVGQARQQPQQGQGQEEGGSKKSSLISLGKAALVLGSVGGAGTLTYWLS